MKPAGIKGCLGCNTEPIRAALLFALIDPGRFIDVTDRPVRMLSNPVLVPCHECGRIWLVKQEMDNERESRS